MNGDGAIALDWGGEERLFRLRIGQMRELQEAINRPRALIGAALLGPRAFYSLLIAGDAWPHEVREVIKLGLIGGGANPGDVAALLRRYFDERPFTESALVAAQIFGAGWAGPPEDTVGKKPQAETATSRSPSPPSTEPAAPSGFRRERSIN